jgi:nitrite reductase (NADH) large subunit
VLICHCNSVSDRAIRRAVRNGAITASEVSSACDAGGSCGGCADAVEELIRSESHERGGGLGIDSHSAGDKR